MVLHDDIWETSSGIPLKPVYTDADVPDSSRHGLLGQPGEAPFVRGAYPEMYRSKLWRIFQLSGFGDPNDMNQRLKFLLDAGETGIIVKHDRMTDDHLYDVDHPEIMERREDVGLTGTVTVGLRDYEKILEDIPIESVYCKPGGGVPQSAPYTQACYWSVAEKRGIPLKALSGTGQSDFFLTYLGCPMREQIPPEAALRFNLDLIDWCTERMPKWVPVSIAGYNGADSGLNAYQELGSVFANAIEYIDGALARGNHPVEDFIHGIGGVNFRTSMDIFEDIAKLRAARKIWSDLLQSRYGISDEKKLRLRIHVVTAGSSMTYQEPFNNIVRGTVMALVAALGGTQSLGVSGYDEALSIPSDHAHLMSIRIQQILQEETNLTAVADPLGGSFLIENLTDELERRSLEFLEEIENRGGFIASIADGWLMRKAEEGNSKLAGDIETGKRRVVGVNVHPIDDSILEVEAFEGRSGQQSWENAMERLTELRHTRSETGTKRSLDDLCRTLDSNDNLVPAVMKAVQADASIGEIGHSFRKVLGNWTPPSNFF
jgi:methylmalonyl-CoA mutase N-terminal domain/subunit